MFRTLNVAAVQCAPPPNQIDGIPTLSWGYLWGPETWGEVEPNPATSQEKEGMIREGSRRQVPDPEGERQDVPPPRLEPACGWCGGDIWLQIN